MKRYIRTNSRRREGIAIGQILILIIGIVGLSYALGSEIGFVSAAATPVKYNSGDPVPCADGSSKLVTLTYQASGTNTVEQTLGYNCDPTSGPTGQAVTFTKTDGVWSGGIAAGSCQEYTLNLAIASNPSSVTKPAQCSFNSGTSTVDYVGTSSSTDTPPSSSTTPSSGQTVINCNENVPTRTIVHCDSGYKCSQGAYDPNDPNTWNSGTCVPDTSSSTNSDVQKEAEKQCGQSLAGQALLDCVTQVTNTVSAVSGVSGAVTKFKDFYSKLSGTPSLTSGLPVGTSTAANPAGVAPSNVINAAPGASSGAASTGAAEVSPFLALKGWGALQVIGNILISAGAAAVIAGIFEGAKKIFGVSPGSATDETLTAFEFAAAGAAFGATGIGSAIATAIGTSAWVTGLVGAGLALVLFGFLYHKQSVAAVTIQCVPWQPKLGGEDCSKCGQDGLPCTQYQCASLGTACVLLSDPNHNGKPVCVHNNTGDINPPTISFWNDIISTGYSASPSDAITPPDTGVAISPKVDINSAIDLGVSTNEVSECKIGLTRGTSFDDMTGSILLGTDGGVSGTESIWGVNHSISVPIFESIPKGGIGVSASGQTSLYVRCTDVEGNKNSNAFVIQFNVKNAPDTTPPQIKGTNYIALADAGGTPIAAGVGSVPITLYVSDESGIGECRWSHIDPTKDSSGFGSMTDGSLDCASSPTTTGAYPGAYKCTGTLDGIKDGARNDFYFRCNDTLGNVDSQSYKLTLLGTQALTINLASPNKTLLQDSTDPVKINLSVSTSAGYNQGESTCYYKQSTESDSNYVQFDGTDTYMHSAIVYLPTGDYTYDIKCNDLGNNQATTSIKFSVKTDTQAPIIVRAYKDNNNLVVETNENATCVYDISDLGGYNFDDGNRFTTIDNILHSTQWINGQNYYIKCKDAFGNKPAFNQYTIVVKAS